MAGLRGIHLRATYPLQETGVDKSTSIPWSLFGLAPPSPGSFHPDAPSTLPLLRHVGVVSVTRPVPSRDGLLRAWATPNKTDVDEVYVHPYGRVGGASSGIPRKPPVKEAILIRTIPVTPLQLTAAITSTSNNLNLTPRNSRSCYTSSPGNLSSQV